VTLSVSRNSLDEQVRERFRLDAFLAPIPFDIVAEGAVIRLKGKVDNDALKKRAVDIAETTIGVEKVIDEITVEK
jgi:osmotically-inducible protein OsmY